MPYVLTVGWLGGGAERELLFDATSVSMPGCFGSRRVCAVNNCTKLLAIAGAMLPELAKTCVGVMLLDL